MDIEAILAYAAWTGQYYLDDMISGNRLETGGEQQYCRYGLTGARGEAASGFASVMQHGLPVLESELKKGRKMMEAGQYALLSLMAHVQDSNVIRKGGMQAQQWMQVSAMHMLREGFCAEELRMMNREFVQRRISPGGCADLLAVTYLIHMLRQTGGEDNGCQPSTRQPGKTE